MSAREQNELQQVKNLLTEERTKRESTPSPTFPSFLPSFFSPLSPSLHFIYLVLELEEELKSSLAELEMAKSAAPPPTDNSAIFEEKNK